MKTNAKKGFTLIELLIVIAIIGILAAALLPNILGAPKSARDTARKVAVNDIIIAVEQYKATNGQLPGGKDTAKTECFVAAANQTVDKALDKMVKDGITGIITSKGLSNAVDANPCKTILYQQAVDNSYYVCVGMEQGGASSGGFFGVTNPAAPALPVISASTGSNTAFCIKN